MIDNEVEPKPEVKSSPQKRKAAPLPDEEGEDDEEPVQKRPRKDRLKKASNPVKEEPLSRKAPLKEVAPVKREFVHEESASQDHKQQKENRAQKVKEESSVLEKDNEESAEESGASEEDEEDEEEVEERPEVVKEAREKIKTTLKSSDKDPYPDWPPGDPVPYAALCTTFSLIEMTTKRLQILAHCCLFLRQVLRLTPDDLLPTVHLMTNKLAADYAGIELGIGESLIMKAIGEATGRSLNVVKQDQNEIGDLGLVAAKSRSTQPTMFKPKALTVRSVFNSLMGIATVQGSGAQQRKIDGIKKLLSSADAAHAGKGSKGIDIETDKGGPSEAKFIVRALEGKLRLGLADKSVPVALAQAMVLHETEQKTKKLASTDKIVEGESIIKSVYRYV